MKYGYLFVCLLLVLYQSSQATITFLKVNGADSNFTMAQGDTLSWHADVDTGGDVYIEIWYDVDSNNSIDPSVDKVWEQFYQTDGDTSEGQGVPDGDGSKNGEVKITMNLGIAPGRWILKFKDQSDASTLTNWGTVTVLPSPAFVVTGTLSAPGSFDPSNIFVEAETDSNTTQPDFWMGIADSNGVYSLYFDSSALSGDPWTVQFEDVDTLAPAPDSQITLAGSDTTTGINGVYANPVAWVYGYVKDDRDSLLVISDFWATARPSGSFGGDDEREQQTDSTGFYQFVFGSSNTGKWEFGLSSNSLIPTYMEPNNSTVDIQPSDSIQLNIIVPFVDDSIYGKVMEDGAAPSQSYKVQASGDSGSTNSASDTGSGVFWLYVSSNDTSYSVSIDTNSRDNGTPLPAGYSVEGNFYKTAAPGDTVTFNLVLGGAVSGTLKAASDSSALKNIQVELQDSDLKYVTSVSSDSIGYYIIEGISPDSYYVYVRGSDSGYVSEYYDNVTSSSNAALIVVAASDTVDSINFYLGEQATITGYILDSKDSSAVVNIQVALNDTDWKYITGSMTDSSGYFSISGINPDSYYVQIEGEQEGYLRMWYDEVTDQSSASLIWAGAGATTSIDTQYQLKVGSIDLTVTSDSSGNTEGISNLWVYLYNVNNESSYTSSSTTDSSGHVTFGSITPGNYKLWVDEQNGNYKDEWWNNAESFNAADTITVTSGDTTVIAMGLDLARGTITGTVYEALNSSSVDSVWVYAYTSTDDNNAVDSVLSDSAGGYTLDSLPANINYNIFAEGVDHGLVNEWYNDWATSTNANDVYVNQDSTISGIDFYLDSSASISGNVYKENDSTAIESAQVTVYLSSGAEVDDIYTDTAGYYSFAGLFGTSYKLEVNAGNLGYGLEWWNDKSNESAADVISLSIGQDSAGINFYLKNSGALQGTVYAQQDSSIISGIVVSAYDTVLNLITSSTTDTSGAFDLSGLLPGTYLIKTDDGQGFFGEWWDDKMASASADQIVLDSAKDSTGFTFYLNQAALITGTIKKAADSTSNWSSFTAAAISAGGVDTFWATTTGDSFYINNLDTGNYFVEYYSSNFRDQQYNGDTLGNNIDTVTLQFGDTFNLSFYVSSRLVINEIYYDGGNSQTDTTLNPEFIELYVKDSVNASNWLISNININSISIPSNTPKLGPGDRIVAYLKSGTDTTIGTTHYFYAPKSDHFPDKGGEVILKTANADRVDVVFYEGGAGLTMSANEFCGWPNDGSLPTDSGATATDSNWSVSLMPDGEDSNNGNNWFQTIPTAGAEAEVPVVLSSFTAEISGNSVVLQWKTQSEESNLGWNIYRKVGDSNNFEKITTTLIPGAGTSAQPQSYGYTDLNVLALNQESKKIVYFIEQVDYNGSKSFSSEITLLLNNNPTIITPDRSSALVMNDHVIITPNPFMNSADIIVTLPEQSALSVTIFTIHGQRVRSLAAGYYNKAGIIHSKWNGLNDNGVKVAKGTYIVFVQINGKGTSKELTLMR